MVLPLGSLTVSLKVLPVHEVENCTAWRPTGITTG